MLAQWFNNKSFEATFVKSHNNNHEFQGISLHDAAVNVVDNRFVGRTSPDAITAESYVGVSVQKSSPSKRRINYFKPSPVSGKIDNVNRAESYCMAEVEVENRNMSSKTSTHFDGCVKEKKFAQSLPNRECDREEEVARFEGKAGTDITSSALSQKRRNKDIQLLSSSIPLDQRECEIEVEEKHGTLSESCSNTGRVWHRQRQDLIETNNFLEDVLKLQRSANIAAQYTDPVYNGLEIANTLTKLGQGYERLGKYNDALRVLEEALSLQRSAAKNIGSNEKNSQDCNNFECYLIVARTLNLIGRINLNVWKLQNSRNDSIRFYNVRYIDNASKAFREELKIRMDYLQSQLDQVSSINMQHNRNLWIEVGTLNGMIGLLMARNRKYDEASISLRTAILNYRKGGLGIDHPSVVSVMKLLGSRKVFHVLLTSYWCNPGTI